MPRIGLRSALTNLIVILAFGVLVPYVKGFDFLDPILIVCYAMLSVVFVTPVIADFVGSVRDSSAHLFAAIAKAVFLSWGISVAILLLGIATVNLTTRHVGVLHPAERLVASALALGLASCLFVAAGSAFLTLLFSAATAKSVMRIGFLLLLGLILLGPKLLPAAWQEQLAEQMTTGGISRLALGATGVVALADVILLAALRSAPIRAASPPGA